ncbi:MAG: lysophospholipid acyltransferase family protein [Spirochaetales bacterium]|nr:lysophospholipid acyltransferase family protein [Spirochaetales bacterium]
MVDLSQFETFETEKDRHQSPWRFFFGRRLSFYLAFIRIVLRCRKFSLQGRFDNKTYFNQSDLIRIAAERHGAKFKITGLQNLNFDGPCVIVANHMSLLETQILPWVVGSFKPFSVVMKKSLYESSLFGAISIATQSIAVSRENLRADIDVVMKEGVEYLKKGRSILLFPEGTRKEYFKRSEFNQLGTMLASRAGVKIVPLALKTDFLRNGKKFSDYGTLHPEKQVLMEFGKPITIEGRGKTEHQEILDFLETTLSGWGVEIKGDEE